MSIILQCEWWLPVWYIFIVNQFSDRSAALAGFCGPNRLWVGVGLTHSRTVSATVLSVAAGRIMLRFFYFVCVCVCVCLFQWVLERRGEGEFRLRLATLTDTVIIWHIYTGIGYTLSTSFGAWWFVVFCHGGTSINNEHYDWREPLPAHADWHDWMSCPLSLSLPPSPPPPHLI